MNDVYRIARWDELYEKNRTREMARMQWLSLPVNLSGDGYTLTMENPDGTKRADGPALYGCFVALLAAAAECSPRGTLVRSNGLPHDAASLGRKIRQPAELVQATLDFFSGEQLKWIECGEGAELVRGSCGDGAPQDSTVHNSTVQQPPPKDSKTAYRDNVKLTASEHARLVNAHGEWFVDRCLDKLDAWKGQRGKRLKSDYKAILNWVVGAIREDIQKGRLVPPKEGASHGGKYEGTGATV
jgi:hypothetical protein